MLTSSTMEYLEEDPKSGFIAKKCFGVMNGCGWLKGVSSSSSFSNANLSEMTQKMRQSERGKEWGRLRMQCDQMMQWKVAQFFTKVVGMKSIPFLKIVQKVFTSKMPFFKVAQFFQKLPKKFLRKNVILQSSPKCCQIVPKVVPNVLL